MDDIVIIGGGISGLYILEQLTSKYTNLKIKLLERDPHLGGRIHTKYYKNGNVKYETGPWRIHNTHKQLLELLDKYNLKYIQNSSSHTTATHDDNYICKYNDAKTIENELIPGLSYRDVSLINNQTCSTQKIEAISKIPLIMDSTSKPYDVNLSYKGKYYIVEKGFSELISVMSKQLHDYIHLNSNVVDVNRKHNHYIITYKKRNANKYITYTIKTKYLFLCIPPEYSMHWTIVNKYLLPLIHSVGTIPLHHIYGYSNKLHTLHNNKFYLKNDTELGQIISGDFNNNWFQISYSSGENAKFLYRLKQHNNSLFNSLIKQKLKQLDVKIPITKIESHYWEHAIHFWKPSFEFDSNDSKHKSIYPHPVNLPNLFYAGEAFSTIQGWIEGALDTSNLALHTFYAVKQQNYIFKPIHIKTNDYVILDNRYLDVKKWKKVHPGSTAAIQNHLKEDISNLFRQIKHTHYSWAIVNSIQTLWIYNNKIGTFVIQT